MMTRIKINLEVNIEVLDTMKSFLKSGDINAFDRLELDIQTLLMPINAKRVHIIDIETGH